MQTESTSYSLVSQTHVLPYTRFCLKTKKRMTDYTSALLYPQTLKSEAAAYQCQVHCCVFIHASDTGHAEGVPIVRWPGSAKQHYKV